MVTHKFLLWANIKNAKIALDQARRHGDPLQIDLAEEALNSLLDELVTCNASNA